MDIIVSDEYVKVTNKDGSLALAKFFKNARIETGGTVERGKLLSAITAKGLLEIPAKGEMIEKDSIYKIDEKPVVCLKSVIVDDNTIKDITIVKIEPR